MPPQGRTTGVLCPLPRAACQRPPNDLAPPRRSQNERKRPAMAVVRFGSVAEKPIFCCSYHVTGELSVPWLADFGSNVDVTENFQFILKYVSANITGKRSVMLVQRVEQYLRGSQQAAIKMATGSNIFLSTLRLRRHRAIRDCLDYRSISGEQSLARIGDSPWSAEPPTAGSPRLPTRSFLGDSNLGTNQRLRPQTRRQ